MEYGAKVGANCQLTKENDDCFSKYGLLLEFGLSIDLIIDCVIRGCELRGSCTVYERLGESSLFLLDYVHFIMELKEAFYSNYTFH